MRTPEMIYPPKPLPRVEGVTEAKTTADASPVSKSPVERFAAMPGLLNGPPSDLRTNILEQIKQSVTLFFAVTAAVPLVRIKRSQERQRGCLSYPGTQLLYRPKNAPTLNLEGFTMDALNYFVIADR